MTRFLICTAPLLLVSAPALAQETSSGTSAPQATPAATGAETAKKVCRTYQVTGRRISKRVCYTASQWAELDRVRGEAASKMISDISSAAAKANLTSDPSGALDTSGLFGFGKAQSPTPFP